MSNECPYCKAEMESGFITNPRGGLKWHKEDAGFIERNLIFGGEHLDQSNELYAHTNAKRCFDCNKIIIDINNLKFNKRR